MPILYINKKESKEMITINKEKLVYIYDLNQAKYYMEQGCICLQCDINPSSRQMYWVFYKDSTREYYRKWKQISIENAQ